MVQKGLSLTNFVLLTLYFFDSELVAFIFGKNLVRKTDLNHWGCLSGYLMFCPKLSS